MRFGSARKRNMKRKFCVNLFCKNGQRGRRVSKFVIGLACLATANWASALGFGEITLNSTLDQPLDAEIKLLEVRDLTDAEILISLASESAFQQQGVDRNFFLTSIKYDVVLRGPGAPYVKLSSERPVREPFLNFILEAQWPSGKLLREYTVLLDLPVFSDEPAAPVNNVQTETVQQRVIRPNPQARSSASDSSGTRSNPRSSFDQGRSSSVSSSSAGQPAFSGDQYGVQRNDTLWEIALAVRPDQSVSVHQTMMALHSANPDAFINGNINLLKTGRVLRVPNADEIYSLNRRQAVKEVASHNAKWSGGAAPIDASRSDYGTQTQESAGEGRLSLASPNDSFDASEGRVAGGSSRGGSGDALAQELNATQETLDKTQSENSELRSKIDSLEDQIATLESMLEVSSDGLRALELSSAATEDSLASSDSDLAGTDIDIDLDSTDVDSIDMDLSSIDRTSLGDSIDDAIDDSLIDSESVDALYDDGELVDGDSLLDSELDLTDSTEEVTSEAEVEVEEAPKPAPVQPKKASFFDTLMDYIAFIGIGFVALLAGIWFFLKGRNSEDESEDDFDAFFGGNADSAVAEDTDLGSDDFDSIDEFIPEEEPTDDLEDVLEEPLDDDESPEAETEDVVAESDIYIAYGKYDQAEEMLQKALKKDPSYHEARLKLLEVHAAQGNLKEFDPGYAMLLAGGASGDFVSRAASLRETFTDAGEFDAAAHDVTALEMDGESVIDDLSSLDDVNSDLELDTSTALDEASADLDDTLLSLDETSADLEEPVSDLEESLTDLDDASDTLETQLDLPSVEGGDTSDLLPSDGDDGIDFDLEGIDFADGEAESDSDTLDELLSESGADGEIELELDSDDTDVDIAEGIDLELDIDSAGLSADTDAGIDADDLELSLEGLDDLELSDGDNDIELEIDLDDAENELTSLDIEESSVELDEGAAVEGDESEFDLGELSTDLDDIETEDAKELLDLDDAPVLDLAESEAEDALDSATDALPDEAMDDLEAPSGDFDMAALDEELDALTSGLDDGDSGDSSLLGAAGLGLAGLGLAASKSSDAFDGVNDGADAATEINLEDELEADLANLSDLDAESLDDLDVESLDLEDAIENADTEAAQADLDATIAEGEDILAELDADDIDLSDSAVDEPITLEAPDLEFDESDELPDLDEPQTDFDVSEPDEDDVLEINSVVEASDEPDTSESSDVELPDVDPDSTDDDDLDFLSDSDETATKLDLASAYIDMGDLSGAKEIIDEVLNEGSEEQQEEAKELLAKIEG